MTEGTTTGSTVPRRQLGRYLRDLRNRSRLTVRAAATQLEWSEAKIWRIETGQSSMDETASQELISHVARELGK